MENAMKMLNETLVNHNEEILVQRKMTKMKKEIAYMKQYLERFLSLTRRELQVLQLLAAGHTSREIAEKLFVAKSTVITHRKNIMTKLQMNCTAHLVLFANCYDIIDINIQYPNLLG